MVAPIQWQYVTSSGSRTYDMPVFPTLSSLVENNCYLIEGLMGSSDFSAPDSTVDSALYDYAETCREDPNASC
jgi:hypothetical protein